MEEFEEPSFEIVKTIKREREPEFKLKDLSEADCVTTPDWIIEYLQKSYPIDYDPCPENPHEDGLKVEWKGFAFVNPPNSECQVWVEKATIEASKGHFSVLLIPATFNSVYWRELVYPNATEIKILTCPIKFQGQKKQLATQMALVTFASQDGNDGMPLISVIEPAGWEKYYYKRRRNMARFKTSKLLAE